ncbi:MAG: dihydroorotase [Actinobacteria bacterium]|nr:dihydroorotase [Actinomycetota bacterium]
MTLEYVIKGGRVIDERGEQFADVVVRDGEIVGVGADLSAGRVIDAAGCVVAPGLIDLHTHLREPGKEEAETVDSGSNAAALGGYTAVVAMPNTTPAIDCASVVRDVLALAKGARCHVEVAGAITVNRAGEQLAPMGEMAALGVKLFTDDGTGVQDIRLMRRALEYAKGLGVTLAQHCEVAELSAGTVMHEGEWSARLGMPGQPAEAEELMVMRDIALARMTGARVHFLHMSTAGSVAMIEAAKASGLPITAEAAPHHFTLTDECCATFDSLYKVHPPLRTSADVRAVKAGLRSGVLDAIATDHAPHAAHEKEKPFDEAPPGMLGLEYALALAITELGMDLGDVLARLSWQPARIAGIADTHGGLIAPGRRANVMVFNPEEEWTIDASGGASRSSNVPYVGRTVLGKVRHTILEGTPVVLDGELTH